MNILPRVAFVLAFSASVTTAAAQIEVARAPASGLQPQVAADTSGVVHLITFVGDPMAGDLEYRKRLPGKSEFAAPLRVNSVPGSAIAMGTVRGAHLAVGRDGWVHVAWMGA